MRPPQPLPEGLSDRFRVRDALDAGATARRLRAHDLSRPFHGSRGGSPDDPAAYAPLLRPGDRFSHTSAAGLWGIPLPPMIETLHVTATAPRNAPRAVGISGHVGPRDLAVCRGGLPVTPPAELFLELSSCLSLDDLVAAGDALVFAPRYPGPDDLRPLTSIAQLRALLTASPGRRGVQRARAALALVRLGAESAMESRLRVLLSRSGLPEPEVNPDIRDSSGRFLGRFDLVYRDERVIVEYDGDHHRTSTAQYERDITRLERAREAGWVVLQVRAHGVYRDPGHTVARIRRALYRR